MDLRASQASVTLDAIRALAAQAVCVGHTIGLFGVVQWAQPPHVPYMQNVAVLLFFLLSGFLIAHVLDSRSQDASYGFGHYFIDRFARIYSALIPCLIAIAVIDFAWTSATGETHATFTARDFAGSLLMLNDVAGKLDRFHFRSFGTAGQLWTLAVEWHIYILAGALFFARRSPWTLLVAGVALLVPVPYLWNLRSQDFGHGVTSLWIAGFLGFYIVPQLARLRIGVLIFSALASLGLYAALVQPEIEFQINTYPLLAIGFYCVVAASSKFKPSRGAIVRAFRFMAAYSFTLYLVHNSIVKAIWHVWKIDPHAAAVIAIIAANVLSVLIASYTEMRHRELSRFLLSHLGANITLFSRRTNTQNR